MNSALTATNLTVTYPGFDHSALEDVSFEIPKGGITAMIGPNGSGKTSIIRSILGLIPYQGEIKIFGQPIEKAREKIGYVPQRFAFDLSFPITVFEFISMVVPEKQKREKAVKKVLEYVEATNLIERRLASLSGGQLQRILLARALVKDPALLLLDEPEAGVDIGGEQTFYDLMEKLVKKENLTAIIASHELDIVYAYAKDVICVNKRMLCHGAPREVLNQETFLKLYGRSLKYFGHTDHRHH